MTKTYSGALEYPSFAERFHYLRIGGKVGVETFGVNRFLNQKFYRTEEWKRFRNQIIIRDNGNDLGADGCPIEGKIYIHHIVPITMDDILNRNLELLLNPDNAISCSFATHQAIHYGDDSILQLEVPERKPGDTKLW